MSTGDGPSDQHPTQSSPERMLLARLIDVNDGTEGGGLSPEHMNDPHETGFKGVKAEIKSQSHPKSVPALPELQSTSPGPTPPGLIGPQLADAYGTDANPEGSMFDKGLAG